MRYEIEGGGPRKEHWEIPETALKEAIINALAHRDYYDKGARISIEVFPDRVEITNPGGLSNAITEAEFGTKSHSRNPLIFGLFVRINMVEQIGSGIGRIRDLITKAKLPQPQFKTEGMFTVVFSRTVEKTMGEINLSDTAKRIIELIKDQPNITTQELAESIGISNKAAGYHLAKLQKNNLILREGSKKIGVWKLINETRNKLGIKGLIICRGAFSCRLLIACCIQRVLR